MGENHHCWDIGKLAISCQGNVPPSTAPSSPQPDLDKSLNELKLFELRVHRTIVSAIFVYPVFTIYDYAKMFIDVLYL